MQSAHVHTHSHIHNTVRLMGKDKWQEMRIEKESKRILKEKKKNELTAYKIYTNGRHHVVQMLTLVEFHFVWRFDEATINNILRKKYVVKKRNK